VSDKRKKELRRRKKLQREQERTKEHQRQREGVAFEFAAGGDMANLIEADHSRKQARTEAAGRRDRRHYPGFDFRANDAQPEFVELVRRACGSIDFSDRSRFQYWEAEAYKLIRDGQRCTAFHVAVAVGQVESDVDIRHHIATNLGEQVFALIPPAELARFIPFNDVTFIPDTHQKSIVAHFRTLCRVKSPWGTVYHSRHRPTVEVGGQRLVVAFTSHAVERLCQRMLVRPLCYSNLGDVFAVLDQCLRFEALTLPGGQPGFTFWEHCPRGYWMRTTAEHVLGAEYVEEGVYSYRVGYCPAVIEGGFLKAKTMLFPGWEGTPEHTALWAARLPQRNAWLDLLDNMNASRFREEARPVLHWFHHGAGIPQIRPGEPGYAEVTDRPE
jgi:hypothetical protein